MKYIVGMSGGIDSSVAAVKLKKEGHDVIGVHMILWAEDMHKNKCCSTADLMWARKVATENDIPFYTMDFREVFKKAIVEEAYLAVYEKGRTPNPCVSCNRNIRFGELLKKGLELGVDKVCTGHYARVEKHDRELRDFSSASVEMTSMYRLREGRDKSKEQSYFLHRVTQEKLARMYFPLGDMLKSEVIELAREWRLINPNRVKKESQDLCFLPEKTPEPFLKRQLSKKSWREGDIVTVDGRVIGRHRGLPFYTIGQRRGLEIGGLEKPLYVVEKDIVNNRLIIGKKDQTGNRSIRLHNLNLIAGDIDESRTYDLKIRYAGQRFRGRLRRIGPSTRDDSGELWEAEVELEEQLFGATPGQFAVFYDGEYCVGGGEIT